MKFKKLRLLQKFLYIFYIFTLKYFNTDYRQKIHLWKFCHNILRDRTIMLKKNVNEKWKCQYFRGFLLANVPSLLPDTLWGDEKVTVAETISVSICKIKRPPVLHVSVRVNTCVLERIQRALQRRIYRATFLSSVVRLRLAWLSRMKERANACAR